MLAIHHSVNVYPDMSEDEYVEMQDNPVHLAIDFGGDPILDMFRKSSMWSDLSKRLHFILE